MPLYSKLIGCSVYGSIRVDPIALKIIDTPEFQRMRFIKQLGLCYYVYPSANHTRFEHSLGVYHLAGKMLDEIIFQYPGKKYNIPDFGYVPLDEKLILCIKIAGLCHDIGHGPFSHIFDDILLRGSTHPNKDHEVRSCLIIEKICKRELSDIFEQRHIDFIKSVINPQEEHRGAIYQIVSNYLNGIDVDKFDYLVRDAKTLGIGNSFNPDRLINEFIIDKNGNIAYPKHCSMNVYEMFHNRYMMHKKVYNHKTTKLVEMMISDIFIKVDKIFKMSESIENIDAFCKLTDDTIFNYIKLLTSPPSFCNIDLSEEEKENLEEAEKICSDLESRKFYKQIIQIAEDAREYLGKFIKYFENKYPKFSTGYLEIITTRIGFVSGNKSDPFETIYFYDKKEDDSSFTLSRSHISGLMNNNVREVHTHLVCKNRQIYFLVMDEVKNYFGSV